MADRYASMDNRSECFPMRNFVRSFRGSFRAGSFSLSSGSQFAPVGENIAVINALDHCNRLLHRYKTCLKVIGWHNFAENPCIKMKMFRVLWVFAIFLFILITLSTQAVGCFRRDLVDMTNASLCGEDSDADKVIRCDINFVSTFVIPALLLLATYFYGIYLFWGKQENLENLAEQVYLKSEGQHLEKYVVKIIILYFSLGIFYIVASLVVRIFHSVVFKMFDADVAICWEDFGNLITGNEKNILLIVSLVGFVLHDGVYVVAVMNYVIQSELNISLLSSIHMKVKDKKYNDFDTAIKDIDKAYNCVRVLNGKTATLVALVLLNFVSNAIEGTVALGDGSIEDNKRMAVLTISVVLWSFLAIIPFIQATRVTRACTNLLAVGSVIRVRPLQYQETPQPNLDSFSIYLSSIINMRAEIFGIPIFPWMFNMTAISSALVMLLLCQNGVYQYAKWL